MGFEARESFRPATSQRQGERMQVLERAQRQDDVAESRIAGVDEAGRGPSAGPVVAAAVILFDAPAGLDDSKKLSKAARERLFAALQTRAFIGVGLAEPCEIDSANILNATLRAMTRAVAALPALPASALIDGNRTPENLPCPARAIVGGDASEAAIAAASIIAKVTRDRLMTLADARWPGYGFAAHSGYMTAAHAAALARLGPCPLHRRSFAPVRAAAQAFGRR